MEINEISKEKEKCKCDKDCKNCKPLREIDNEYIDSIYDKFISKSKAPFQNHN